jgi:hypothetical protein
MSNEQKPRASAEHCFGEENYALPAAWMRPGD